MESLLRDVFYALTGTPYGKLTGTLRDSSGNCFSRCFVFGLRETLRETYGTLTGPESPADLPSFALGELTGILREPLRELTEPEWPDDLPFSILEHSLGFVSFCIEFQ